MSAAPDHRFAPYRPLDRLLKDALRDAGSVSRSTSWWTWWRRNCRCWLGYPAQGHGGCHPAASGQAQGRGRSALGPERAPAVRPALLLEPGRLPRGHRPLNPARPLQPRRRRPPRPGGEGRARRRHPRAHAVRREGGRLMEHRATASNARGGRRPTGRSPSARSPARPASAWRSSPRPQSLASYVRNARATRQRCCTGSVSRCGTPHPDTPTDGLAAIKVARLREMAGGDDATALALLEADVRREMLNLARVALALVSVLNIRGPRLPHALLHDSTPTPRHYGPEQEGVVTTAPRPRHPGRSAQRPRGPAVPAHR